MCRLLRRLKVRGVDRFVTHGLARLCRNVSVVEEKPVEEQILDLKDSIEFLGKLWLEEPDIQQEINAEDWKEFMDAVYQSLSELETVQTGDTEIEE
jgi:hypothetical protein